MVRERRLKFVEEEQLFTIEEKRELEISEGEILTFWGNNEECLLFLVKMGVIDNEKQCEQCRDMLSLVKLKRKQSLYRWVCKKPCTFSVSITSNSFLSDTNIRFDKFLMVLFKYINGHEIKEISDLVKIDRKTIGSLLDNVREKVLVNISENSEKLGGLDENNCKKIVEIDESVFLKENIIAAGF